jgi:hypothetical protein
MEGKIIREVELRLTEVLLHDALSNPRGIRLQPPADTCGLTRQTVSQEDVVNVHARMVAVQKMGPISQHVGAYTDIIRHAMVNPIHSDS